MDSPPRQCVPLPDPVITQTGDHQFAASERISQARIQSRTFLWCKTGKGTIWVNGQPILMEGNDFCFLPWDRSQVYLADAHDPFLTSGIHIIPYHSRSHKIVHGEAHSEDDPMFNMEGRSDLPLGILDGVKCGSLNESTALHHLAEYIVQRFREREWSRADEWEIRSLAQLLLAHVSAFFQARKHEGQEIPLPLRQMMQFVQNHIDRKIGLKDLARISGLSVSAVGRMFQKHLRVNPVAYISRVKINYAKNLLAGSRIQVAETGRHVGIDDPYYFSKLFRKTTGLTPLEYRRKSSFL